MITAWDLTRATGFTGLALLSLSLLLGALTSARLCLPVEAHRQASVLGLAFTTLHGALAALSPWLARTDAVAVRAGVLSLMLMWLAALAFAARRFLGAPAWRVLHLVAYSSLIAAIAHGVVAGSSSGFAAAKIAYLAVAVSAAVAATQRLFLGPPLPRPSPQVGSAHRRGTPVAKPSMGGRS